MEQNKKTFGLRLNLFDTIVIVAALLVGGILLWMQMKPAAPDAAPAAEKLRFTIVLEKTVPGTGSQVENGDLLVDTIKNYEIGNVVSSKTVPAQDFALDEASGCYVLADVPEKEDIYITVESNAVVTDESVTVGTGYVLRVGEWIFVRGPGYLGSGKVYAIERGV